MNTPKLILFVIVLCHSTISICQNSVARIGSKLFFGNPDGNGLGAESYFTQTVIADTIINGNTFSKFSYKNYNDSSFGSIQLLTLSNDSIFYFSKKHGKSLLFKTDVKLYDTISIDLAIPNELDSIVNAKIIIDSVQWIHNVRDKNDSLCHWKFHTVNSIGISINTGNYTNKLFTNITNSTPEFIVLIDKPFIPEGNPYLRCCQSGEYIFSPNLSTNNHECDFINVGLNQILKIIETFSIAPNPVSETLSIIASNNSITGQIHYKIINMIGKIEFEGFISNTDLSINTSNLTKGFYILQLSMYNEYQKNNRLKFLKN